MPTYLSRLLGYAALLLLTQCSKCKDDPAPRKPEDRLPAATQTGANTFGCLLNGQPFLPKGDFSRHGLVVSYDPDLNGGTLQIRARGLTQQNQEQLFILGGAFIARPGNHAFAAPGGYPYFFDESASAPCDSHYNEPEVYRRGSLTITRLDVRAGIVSGTFEFTLAKPGCDTIKVTHGRFDKQL
ncbi:hypothetical protein [Hymenobacter sp. B81]|uniref:hypothetical protein n=1 Tax=Hymenobacter sp. B81 TaxID=3344878 RepID=UPI0037DD4DB8